MLTLIFILLITFASLTVILWAGTFFFQGYIYPEPSPGIFLASPAAAFLLTDWLHDLAYDGPPSRRPRARLTFRSTRFTSSRRTRICWIARRRQRGQSRRHAKDRTARKKSRNEWNSCERAD